MTSTLYPAIPALSTSISEVIDCYDAATRMGVLQLRGLILNVARSLSEPIEETLRWGQPAYIAPKGSTLRLGPHKDASFAIFAHCQSSIITSYAQAFPGWDKLDGNRAILFDHPDQIEPERLTHLIRHALTYHTTKNANV